MTQEKTQSKPVTLSYTERIEMSSAAKLIAESKQASNEEARAAILRVADAECGQIARSIEQDLHAGLHTAEADEELLRRRADEARLGMTAAAAEQKESSRRGSWVKVAIWAVFAVACFAAEFVLTWTALCFVLNVQRNSVLGVLLGLAPPSGLAVLEIVLARLFEDPWQKLRRAAASGKKLAINVVMATLLVALALGNGMMIVHLAKAREEAAKLQRALTQTDSDADPDVDQAAIDQAILLVSILVTADGAVFLLLSLGESSAIVLGSRLRRQAWRTRSEWESLEASAVAAGAKTASLREEVAGASAKAALAAERYAAHCRFLLAEKAAAELERPIEQLVDRAFRKKLAA